ncbi:MAG: restriction endonuclease [Burkholderiaceae bacterium]
MKWQMAENSLFAMLLRAPWYTSVGLSLASVGLSFALLPGPYVVFGLAASLPFIGIACYVLYKLAQKPRASVVEAVDGRMRQMNAKEFAAELTRLFQQSGHTVEPGKKPPVDLVVTKGWRVSLVNFKKWKAAHLGIEQVRSLYELKDEHEANNVKIVTLGRVSETAGKYAQEHNIEIVGAERLAEMMSERAA